MCVAERVRVVEVAPETAIVLRPNGKRMRVSLLALAGDPPMPGNWLLVHSGIALQRATQEDKP